MKLEAIRALMDAALAYNKAARSHFGEFAKLNPVEPKA